MADGSHLFDSLKSVIDGFHNNCYRIILEIANKVSISEAKSRTAAFQKNRNNVPSELVSDCFLKVVSLPLLDHLLTHLNVRFDSASVMVYGGKSLDPLQSFIKVIFLAIRL